MAKWEYCEVVSRTVQAMMGWKLNDEFISYGNQPVKIKGQVHDFINNLGLEEWELVSYTFEGGINNNPEIQRWVFKREVK